MPVESHLILDIGPGIVAAVTVTLAAIPGILAAYYAYKSKQAIDTANSHLAIALNQMSNPVGESKLTISPLPSPATKEA
jgi:hypothetical protein